MVCLQNKIPYMQSRGSSSSPLPMVVKADEVVVDENARGGEVLGKAAKVVTIDKDGDGKLSIHELYDVVEEAVAAKQARAPLPRPLAVPAARRTRAP